MKLVGNIWDLILEEEYKKDYFKRLILFINKVYKEKVIFPPKNKILRALELTDYDNVKVVILGQDPYHGENEANGLSFSVSKGVKLPPSLKNIYKELNDDLGITIPVVGTLECWAKEGVLLLNSVLTVEKDRPASHKDIGWERFTDTVIEKLNEREKGIVFILWGSNARSKKCLITNPSHHVIESVHPSPLSAHRGFFGGKYFSKANSFLDEPIDWSIDE